MTHFLRNFTCCSGCCWTQAESDRVSKILAVQFFIRDLVWSSPCISYHLTPERLISKEWHDNCRPSIIEAASGGASASMMNHSGHLLKQPFVWTIVQIENVLSCRVFTDLTPATGDKCTCTRLLHGVQQDSCKTSRIINDDATESYIDWGRSRSEESCEIWRRIIGWCFSKEESTNIFTKSALLRPKSNEVRYYRCGSANQPA